jgi:hypothetical protein
MKKIDILNFITNFRKAPNDIKTHHELISHLGIINEPVLNQLIEELKSTRVIRETNKDGQKAYQVISR